MSPSAQPRPAKRKRLASPSAHLSTDVTMSDSPPGDPVGDMETPPPRQSGSVDTESLILGMIQTEASAPDLVKVIKTRRVRDVLKQHGIKIQAEDDVGYNSLPRELRDNIRKCSLDSFPLKEHAENLCDCRDCRRYSRLAPYACIDSEWRDAIEPFIFQRLGLRMTNKSTPDDLGLFESWVVGKRREYLQQICLRVDSLRLIDDEALEEEKVDDFISPISRLFNCLKQWDKSGRGNGNLHVLFETTDYNGRIKDPSLLPLEQLHTALTNLPTTQQITQFYVLLCQPMDARPVLALLSRMPALRSVAINLQTYDLPDNAQNAGAQRERQIELFFNSLPQAAPKIECLEVRCQDDFVTDNLEVKFCKAAFSYSQRLREFSLTNASMPVLRSIWAPFSNAKFNSEAPPPLIWPNLTNFTIETIHYSGNNAFKAIDFFMLKIGRAIKYMPSIQNLGVGLSYTYDATQDNGFDDIHSSSEVLLLVKPPASTHGHSPLATMYVNHDSDPRLVEKVPSENVVQLWRESLLHTANASLDVQMSFVTQWGKRVLNPTGVREIEEL